MTVYSAPVELALRNDEAFALRRTGGPLSYRQFGGEVRADSQKNFESDQKFRVKGSPIFCEPGPKELHLSIKGEIVYNVLTANFHLREKIIANPDAYSESEIARLRRHMRLMAMVDVELWAMSDATPAPFRAETLTNIDSDWSENAPLSRVDFTKLAELYTTKTITPPAGEGSFFQNLGVFETEIGYFQPTPIVRIDTMASVIVPVVTLHLGARTLSAENVTARIELAGKCFWMG